MEHLQESLRHRAGLLALLLSVAALCFISGCDTYNGLSSALAPGYVGPGNVGMNEVWIMNSVYHLDTITIQRYTTITWINKDPSSHTVTSDEGLFDSGTLSSNGTYEHTFETTGTFPYHSLFQANMHGTVIVQ
jgi:plastocyanin